jgi:hypothetical protein
MNTPKRPLHLKTTSLIGLLGLATISMMDLSSYCHPSDGAKQLTNQVKSASIGHAEVLITVAKAADLNNAVSSESEELTWRTLEDVEFKDVYVEELDAYYWKPTFGPAVTGLEDKDVYITGYMIPVDLDEDFYVLSRYPFANCFFCGGAGPESVVDLRFPGKSSRVYQTDERLTFKGNFHLNADDVYQMNYILDGAVEYEL